jgi:hypothetical protein
LHFSFFLLFLSSFSRSLENNMRHKKEVAGLVLGVESGLSKERLTTSLQLKRLAVCAPAHKGEAPATQVPTKLKCRAEKTSPGSI